ncbi:hypothetical protein BTJ39_22110 [Izhakiella australiensis]|uniref:NAD-dependent epimerase/dehydratase domain-containing protein n=2 Tax=Izhakiella australiensis TaxID=1926881 RepID=A0A1S8Y960_9GAMM|nr:hypothetical protein BTJ39_22110 [Izhakiella australiensis]
MDSNKGGVLVSGGAGFIGKALIKEILKKKIPLVSFDVVDKPDSLPEQGSGFNWFNFSYLDANKRRDEIKTIVTEHNIKTVIHLATTMFPADSRKKIIEDCFENVYSNVSFFKELYESGCEKIIFASSGGTVYGKSESSFSEESEISPEISYGLSKATTETYLRFLANEYNKKSISLRISNPYGEGQRFDGKQGVIPIFINKIFNDIPLDIIGSLDSRRDYIHISDLVNAFICAIYYEGFYDTFNIGSGESVALKELIKIIELKLNKNSLINEVSSQVLDKKGVTLIIQRAKNELNWLPAVKLNDGIEQLIESFRCADYE